MQNVLIGENLGGCAFVCGSLSFLDKISCGLALYVLQSFQSKLFESSVFAKALKLGFFYMILGALLHSWLLHTSMYIYEWMERDLGLYSLAVSLDPTILDIFFWGMEDLKRGKKKKEKKRKKNLRAKMDNTITKSKNEKPKYTQAMSCHLKKKKKKKKRKERAGHACSCAPEVSMLPRAWFWLLLC